MVFYLNWAQGFPRKNRVFFISADIYFLLCQEHPVRTGIPAIYENLAILDKIQFTPLLCFVLSNRAPLHITFYALVLCQTKNETKYWQIRMYLLSVCLKFIIQSKWDFVSYRRTLVIY